MEKFNQLKALVEATEKDVVKSDGGNKASGTRVRKAMQEIKVLAQSIRTEISEKKNGNSIADDETF